MVVGYLDRGREQWQSEDGVFTQHGPFDSREITALLEHYRVRLVAYPSAGPETFSFTLSEAWAAGRPAIVPPIGALAERVAATGAGWVLSEDEWQDEARMLERIAALLDPAQAKAWTAAAARARRSPQPTLAAMAAATTAIYRDALQRQPAQVEATADRCRALSRRTGLPAVASTAGGRCGRGRRQRRAHPQRRAGVARAHGFVDPAYAAGPRALSSRAKTAARRAARTTVSPNA